MGGQMGFSISFLDGDGRLACLLVAHFSDQAHAALYARDVMRIRSCSGRFLRAEISNDQSSSTLTVGAESDEAKILPFARRTARTRSPLAVNVAGP
jgi:hypothetical protein